MYAVHRGRPSEHDAIARSAGAWLYHFATSGYASLSRWLPNYVPDGDPREIRAGLEDALEALEAGLGEPIEPSDEERCRFLFQELSPAELTSVAERLGFEGDPVKESEKLRDTVLRGLVDERAGKLPRMSSSCARLSGNSAASRPGGPATG